MMIKTIALAVMGGQVSGESLLDSIKIAVLPIVKVFTICFVGFLLATKRVNLLPTQGRKFLNGLVFSLLLPCVIFAQLGQAITFEKMIEWWFIPTNVVLGSISGSIIGYIVATIVRPPYPYFKFTIVEIGIGNIGNVPLVLIASLCRDSTNPFGDYNNCSTTGTAYISFGQWVGAIILYTYVFQMLAPPPEGFDNDEEEGYDLPIKITSDELSTKDDKMNPLQAPLLTYDAEEVEQDNNNNNNSKIVPKKIKVIKNLAAVLFKKLKLKQILQPPIIASILAMFIGSVPFLKRLVYADDSPLFFINDSCIILGQAMIPCILLALGGNLVDGPRKSNLNLRTTAAIVFARLVLVPAAGLGIVMGADKLGFLPDGDKMFKFVLLLQHSMPTSILAGVVANLRGCGREAAAVLFWVHIFAVFSMAAWIVLFLKILF